MLEIQQELMRVALAAQQGKLAMGDIQGGTITLSNIGVIGTKDARLSKTFKRRPASKLSRKWWRVEREQVFKAAQDPRPILFDGQAVIGATGRTMTLPRYNSKMEAA